MMILDTDSRQFKFDGGKKLTVIIVNLIELNFNGASGET